MNYCTQLLHLLEIHFIIALMTEPISELIYESISLALHYMTFQLQYLYIKICQQFDILVN